MRPKIIDMAAYQLMGRLLGFSADQLMPHQCLLCGTFCLDHGVCATCWRGAWMISEPLCHHCGRPLPYALPEHLCAACWQAPPVLSMIRASFVYNSFYRDLILHFKHGDGLHLTPILGRFLKRHFVALSRQDQLVIPVPLQRRRYLARRYNQSAELARWLATKTSYAPHILVRRHHNISQAGLSRRQRHRNVAGVFSVTANGHADLQGRPVLLVDDVMTTGATLTAAAKTLLAAGSGPVHGLLVARVL